MEPRRRALPLWVAATVLLLNLQNFCGAAAHTHSRRLSEDDYDDDAYASAPSPEYPPYRLEYTCDFQGPFPYTASLRDANGDYHCGAVLIRNDAVLTAASCVVSNSDSSLSVSEVYLGGLERENPIERRPVVAVFPHEDFNGNPVDGADLAIVKFSGGTCMQPIPFIGRQTSPGEVYIVLGFGRTGPTEPLPGVQHYANVTNIGVQTCKDMGVTPLDDTQICAQHPLCDCGFICDGDAGGPLILRETIFEFEDTLMGIMSYSTKQCDEEGGFGILTDIQPYVNWMDRICLSDIFTKA